MRSFKEELGFTLIEIAIVLGILAVLVAVLVPTLTKYVGEAKIRRAEKDVQMICGSIGQFSSDTGLWPVSSNHGASGGTPAKNDVEVLKGPGNDPTDHATSQWFATANTSDNLDDQLQSNVADYPTTGSRAWQGPYLGKLEKDPWGNAYLVNVEFLKPDQIKNRKSVFVLSAGQNGVIDTPYSTTTGVGIVTPQEDDIICRLK